MSSQPPEVQLDTPHQVRRVARVFGYGVAVAVNILLLVIVRNVVEWGWFGFLTDDFADVEALIAFALVATILVNLLYIIDDRRVVKSSGQVALNLINLYVSVRILSVFPFDFSEHAFDWGTPVRILLVVAIVGAGIGILAELHRLAFGGLRENGRDISSSSETTEPKQEIVGG